MAYTKKWWILSKKIGFKEVLHNFFNEIKYAKPNGVGFLLCLNIFFLNILNGVLTCCYKTGSIILCGIQELEKSYF